jgi:tetratricopeptide (TPR) repeat protein
MKSNAPDRQFFDLATLRRIADALRAPSCKFTLHITDAFSERVIHVADGSIRVCSIGTRTYPDLSGYLIARRLVAADGLRAMVEESQSAGRPLSAILMSRGVLTTDDLNAAITKLVRDAFFDLVFWRDACCTIYDRSPPQEVLERVLHAPAGRLDFEELAQELDGWATRWSDVQSKLHTDTAQILITELGASTLGEYRGHLHDCLDACTDPVDLRTLWSRSDVNLPHLCEQLDEMVKLDWVSIVRPPTGSANSKHEVQREIEVLERNLEHAIDTALVREKLVRLYHKAQLPEKACRHLHALATGDLARDQWEIAVDRWKRILEIDPASLEAFREIIKTNLEHGLEREAVTLIASHARMLLHRHLPDEARAVSQTMQRLPGGRIEADLIEAELLVQEDNHSAAVGLFTSAANMLQETGDETRALKTLERALEFDPTNGQLRQLMLAMRTDTDSNTTVAQPRPEPVRLESVPARQTPARPVFTVDTRVTTGPVESTKHIPRIRLPRQVSWAAIFVIGVFGVVGTLSYVYWTFASSFSPRTAIAQEENRNTSLPDPAELLPPSSGSPARSTYSSRDQLGTRTISGRERNANVGPNVERRKDREGDGLTRRVINETVLATYATSKTLVLTNRLTKQKIIELPAHDDEQWAIGYRGRVICQWRVDQSPRIYFPPSTKPQTLSWKVPPDTVAVAIGPSNLALRRGTHTIFYRYDGKPTGGGEAPLWTEGLYMANRLVLQRPALTLDDKPEVWCLRYPDLKPIWTCTIDDGHAVFR